jgi:hypothetical protein
MLSSVLRSEDMETVHGRYRLEGVLRTARAIPEVGKCQQRC